jgi:hypothetical protein
MYHIRRLKSLITLKYLIVVYHSLFHSHIRYGLLLWGNSSGCKRVLLLQKKALRVMVRVDDG